MRIVAKKYEMANGPAEAELPENAQNPSAIIVQDNGAPVLVATWFELTPAELAEQKVAAARAAQALGAGPRLIG